MIQENNKIQDDAQSLQMAVSGSEVSDELIRQSEELIDKAIDICLLEIEKIARKELSRKKKLCEFVMCMGTYFFTEIKKDAKGHNQISSFESQELEDFMYKYSKLKLTGFAIRFTEKGDVVTDW